MTRNSDEHAPRPASTLSLASDREEHTCTGLARTTLQHNTITHQWAKIEASCTPCYV